MATFTPNKGYALPVIGGDIGAWGAELNNTFTAMDLNLGGVLALNVAGNTNITLTAAQAQNLVVNMTGALTGSITIFVPPLGGMYIFENNSTGAFTITVKTTAGGSIGTGVSQGTVLALFSDGTNVTAQTTPNPGVFSNLTVNGTLNVTGTSTLATLNAGAITGTSLNAGSGGAITTTGTVTGGTVVGGAWTLGASNITSTLATPIIVGGTSGFVFQNHAASTSLVSWDNSGNVTVAGTLGAGAITGTSLNAGSGTIQTTGTMASHVCNVSGNFGTTGGSQLFIVGGPTGVSCANNANTVTNVSWDDSGNVTVRGNINGSGGTITGGAVTSGGNVNVGGAGGFSGKAGTGGGLDGHFFNIFWNGTNAFLFIDASDIGAINVTPVSDRRIKRNIASSPKDFLKMVQGIEVVEYNWRDIGIYRDDGKRHTGFIAQDIERIMPCAVIGEADAVQADGTPKAMALNTIPLIAMNTGAIQELMTMQMRDHARLSAALDRAFTRIDRLESKLTLKRMRQWEKVVTTAMRLFTWPARIMSSVGLGRQRL